MLLQLAIVLVAIIIGARLGGIGLGVMGGAGLAILTFVFGLQPTAPPVDVILMIAAVIAAAASMQAAGGLDYMVKIAEKMLRRNPSRITIIAPFVTYLFTFLAGTGHIAYSLLPVIAEVATETKIRPERPMGIAVIASQQAITASPISAATVALLGLLSGFDITLFDIMKISVPATLIGVLVGAIFSLKVGKELTEDPEYLERLKNGLIDDSHVSISDIKDKSKARLSVIIFLLTTGLIVLFGSVPAIRPAFDGSPLGMPSLIEILMLSAAALILILTRTDGSKAVHGSIFLAGMQAVVAIFGIAWMGDTFIKGNLEELTASIQGIVSQMPWLFGIALFVMSILLFSQAATVRAIVPLGIALGISPMMLIALFPAVNGYFFIPNYPTIVAAINFDRTGTTRIGKWILNHSFMLPGLITTVTSIAAGMLLILSCSSSSPTQSTGTGNPYLPLWEHLPDGEPRVFEDPDKPGQYRIYIIGSHDVRVDSYCGSDIRMWSAPVEDLTAWVDEGPIFTYNIDGQWDVMYAPDLVEVNKRDGTREYYLYPHSRGWGREALVAKSDRPNGPYTVINATEDGRMAVEGSILGFDPSVFVEQIDDPEDPDYEIGFRAYGYWGFQRSSAVELDQNTMYSPRPGGSYFPYFIPSSHRYGVVRQVPGVKEYPALYNDQKPEDFNFFEASSIRKVGNKYVMIFSGYSGPDYGVGSSNSTLRYAYGDSPLGPWRSGGVLVDSRGIVLDEDGSTLVERNAAHNTHGSIEQINGQWYVFYHRPPRGFGFARQPMVAPITVRWDEAPVAEGGKVVIRGYDPYAEDGIWEAKASNGDHYTGAEVTSEGFQIFGMPPYRYYSAGYACFLSDIGSQQDNWDIWDNSMPVMISDNDIVGYKYFGFGGLNQAKNGLQPFEGTKPGNGTSFNLFLTPKTGKAFRINVWLDGPWDNNVWNGKMIGQVVVPAGSPQEVTRFTIDVADAVDSLDRKHAIYLVAEGEGDLCELIGLGFSRKGEKMTYPAPPTVTISVDGNIVEMPEHPVRSNNENGYTGYDRYEVPYEVPEGQTKAPEVSAKADSKAVKIDITQSESVTGEAVVKCGWNGKVKTYTVIFSE